MTQNLDGFPVTGTTVEAVGSPVIMATGDDPIVAHAVIPVVALIRVGRMIFTPGRDDNMERHVELEVARIVVPAGADAERVLDLLRGVPTTAPAATQAVVEERPPAQRPEVREFADMSDVLPPSAGSDEVKVETQDELDPSRGPGGFTMPPPPLPPEGEVTLRRIVPRDERLSRFVRDGGN